MAEWPLRGREDELAHLTELVEDPAARGVVLSGPQGVGKTRLALECLRIAAERGFAVERISATYAASSLPLGAVILSRPPQNALVSSPAEQAELVHRVASDLVRQTGGRRLVMLVDDVHWLDQLSAVLVHQLVVTGGAFVVLTARTGTTAPDSIVALWKDDLIERMAVNAVPPTAVEELVAEALGGPVAGAAVAELVDRCEGNVLYLREQVLAAVESGRLTQDAGVWRLTGTLAGKTAPAPRLVELIEHRLGGLKPDARACLEVIAFGEPLELAEAVQILDEHLIEDLDQEGLIAVRADGWGGAKVLLAHPLTGEVLRAETSVIRARQITSVLATAAEARRPIQADDVLRIANWRLVCGGGTPELMLTAAKSAFARQDYDLAIRFGQAAASAGAGLPARLLVAEAKGFTGRRDEAELELAALQAEVSGPDQLAAIAHARIVQAHFNADVALGSRVYREALAAIDDSWWRAELTAKHSWLVIMQEGPRAGLRATEELWSSSIEGSPLVAAAVIRAAGCARGGRVTDALAAAERGAAAQTRLSEPFDLHPFVVADFYACEALATAGRIDEWEARAHARYVDAVEDRSASMQLYFAYQRANAALARGRVATAASLAGETVGLAHQLNDPHFRIAGLTRLAEALALQGELDGAARALAELESIQQTPWSFAEPPLARAWLAIARGDLVSARRTLEGAAESALACDDLRAASLALHSLVRMGDARIARDSLLQIAERVEGDLVPTQARHAVAVLAHDGAELEQVAAEFARMGAQLLAAEAYCDAAVTFRAAGEPKHATALSQQAAVLLEECEGATTPASQPVEIRSELTQAERRTAMLAAQGQSNRDIAAAEQVSVRTIESRLQCVYVKLGISSRKELAERLRHG